MKTTACPSMLFLVIVISSAAFGNNVWNSCELSDWHDNVEWKLWRTKDIFPTFPPSDNWMYGEYSVERERIFLVPEKSRERAVNMLKALRAVSLSKKKYVELMGSSPPDTNKLMDGLIAFYENGTPYSMGLRLMEQRLKSGYFMDEDKKLSVRWSINSYKRRINRLHILRKTIKPYLVRVIGKPNVIQTCISAESRGEYLSLSCHYMVGSDALAQKHAVVIFLGSMPKHVSVGCD